MGPPFFNGGVEGWAPKFAPQAILQWEDFYRHELRQINRQNALTSRTPHTPHAIKLTIDCGNRHHDLHDHYGAG